MFAYLNWVSDLEGISPIARLLGIRMSNYASYIGDGFDLGPDDPACQIDLAKALAWIGCSEDELRPAMKELIAEGVRPLRIENGKIVYSFPSIEHPELESPSPKPDYPISIYVIRAGATSKVGISKYPRYRLENLQAANPTQRLEMVWTFEGPSKIIRRVERQAHSQLEPRALGHEWFDLHAEHAVETVRALLMKAGLKKQ